MQRGPFDTPGTPPSAPPTPKPAPAIAPAVLARLVDHSGILFDPETGETYFRLHEWEPLRQTPYTFERARWSGPFGLGWHSPWLSPLSFATIETAKMIFHWVRQITPSTLDWSMDDSRGTIIGPFSRTPQRLVYLAGGLDDRSWGCGELAVTIIRQGEPVARKQFLAELARLGRL